MIDHAAHQYENRLNRAALARLHFAHPDGGICPTCGTKDCDIRRMLRMNQWYEDGITWQTTCTNCARLWNDNFEQYHRIETLKQELASDIGGCILCTIVAKVVHNDHTCGCTMEDGPCERHQMLFSALKRGWHAV